MSTHDAYLAAMSLRWHVNPHLSHTRQTLGHHGAAAAILAHALWPDDAEVLWACIAHDLGEIATGDVRLTTEAEAGFCDDTLMCLALAEIEATGLERHDGDSIIIGVFAE